MDVTTVLVALLTLLAGLIAGLAIGRGSGRAAAAERDAVRRDLDQTRADHAATMERTRAEFAMASDRARAELGAFQQQARADHAALDERARAAETEAARLGTALEHQRQAAVEQLARLEDGEKRLRETFSVLSREALSQTSKEFMTLAETRLKQAGTVADGDLAKRQQAIEGMVNPLRETLTKVETQMQSVERERVGSYRALMEQVGTMRQTSEKLHQETNQLVTALRAPQVRGRWGELQLEQIVRTAGMVEHCDFVTQETVSDEDGALLRPDLVVRLGGNKRVIVDAKVSFIGFLEAMEARDDATRTARLRAHARHLREHVDRLAAKSYWQSFEATPEFVVMFVPAEVFLNAALDEDPALLEHAFEHNVVIATPSTLIALLRTVAYTWRQEALAANAHKIHKLGKELHGRLATMGTHIAKLGGQLDKTVKSYNQTVSSLESRVLVSARKLTELQVSDEELVTPDQITEVPRQMQAPELVASARDSLVALRPVADQQELLTPVQRRAPGR
ncbi:MAG TPA: DNA recombination protein RmuC [Mycobacteriales bacterium]|jgi:DNA recombination protein RmuC|nr:DNA recombination protein RmuC [Mycobacteriales bacterium]